eukprot:COSAG01_NODE_11835_length_1850_cov_2.483724_1_plen_184_part_00
MHLSSTVPETVIICRILHELACAPAAQQDAVARLFVQDEISSMRSAAQQDAVARLFVQDAATRSHKAEDLAHSSRRPGQTPKADDAQGRSAADEWIDEQLQRHVFFSQSAKRVEVGCVLRDGTAVRRGDVVGFSYGRMHAETARSLPFGFGQRACPGARIGRGLVKALVGAVVGHYRLSRAHR